MTEGSVNKKRLGKKRKKIEHKKDSSRSRDPSRLEGPTRDEIGNLYFGRRDLLEVNLAEEKIRRATTEVALAERELARLQLEYERKAAIQVGKVQEMKAELARKLVERGRLFSEIEVAYEVKMQNVTYDDETGRILVEEEDQADEAGDTTE